MPFAPPWTDPEPGDLIYGVHSDTARGWYMNYHPKFKNKVFTIDSLITPMDETNGSLRQLFLKAVAVHKKYSTAETGDKTSNEAIRRKCKAGIEWAVTNQLSVHFVLDYLDLNAVVGKNWNGKNRDRSATSSVVKNRSITGSELRWIYRNRANPQVRQHVQFWIMGEPCPPPWEADTVAPIKPSRLETVTYMKNAWAGYVPTRELV